MFSTPPEPLSRRERLAFVALFLLVTASRFLARARSPWDWDEYLFMCGMREYDVADHYPHPPGYPLFIALAKLIRPLFGSDFQALQAIVILSAIALFPIVFFLARELRFPPLVALLGSTLTVFLPNVWLYGGTAFSDIPGLALGLLACALFLKGCRDPRSFVLASLILGLSAGIRTQNLMTAAVPALMATWYQWRLSKKRVIAAIAIGAVAMAACYTGAALATKSVDKFIDAVQLQQKYLREIDSWRGPERPPLRELIVPFFVTPVDARKLFIPLTALAAISLIHGIVRRRIPVLLTVAIFLPFLLFAYFMLAYEAVARYAVAYVPMHAFLAVDTFALFARGRRMLLIGATALTIAAFAYWSWWPMKTVRQNDSPPEAAVQWVLKNVKPSEAKLFVHYGLQPAAFYYLQPYEHTFYERLLELPMTALPRPAWTLHGGDVLTRDARRFRYARDRLWRVARPRNFEISVFPQKQLARFGEGWHFEERGEHESWRWMGKSAEVTLAPSGQIAVLELEGDVPTETLKDPVTLEVQANGQVIARILCDTEKVRGAWTVDGRRPVRLRLTVSRAVNPKAEGISDDARDLGFRLRTLRWRS